MDMEPTIINKAVREILDQLVRDFPDYRWESLCTESDGRGQTIIEVNIYRGGGSRRIGQVTYHLESGDILNFRYRNQLTTEPTSVVDFVLDIVNMEKLQTETSPNP